IVDDQGRKMSKSLGNVISPLKIAEEVGIEIMRLWVINTDTKEDMRISKEILNYQQDIYRRIRNTMRYLIG
ncbi:class I tRNA ligase family protein, partial [Bilophila wadsworthia]|uniref:class I tRNA ligase family protein n=1 Tax=Bilophila wadsworthia TaxID=35833 RepID=UPI001EDB655A